MCSDERGEFCRVGDELGSIAYYAEFVTNLGENVKCAELFSVSENVSTTTAVVLETYMTSTHILLILNVEVDDFK